MKLQQSICTVSTKEEAKEVVQFFFSHQSFDDTRFTPGEIVKLRENPFRSLQQEKIYYWYLTNEKNEFTAVISCHENAEMTGGYLLDFIVVHKEYRGRGFASHLLSHLLEFLRRKDARYIVAYTCDRPEYDSVQRLFVQFEFNKTGYYPDYYFKGEGRISYICNLTDS